MGTQCGTLHATFPTRAAPARRKDGRKASRTLLAEEQREEVDAVHPGHGARSHAEERRARVCLGVRAPESKPQQTRTFVKRLNEQKEGIVLKNSPGVPPICGVQHAECVHLPQFLVRLHGALERKGTMLREPPANRPPPTDLLLHLLCDALILLLLGGPTRVGRGAV